MVDSDDRIKEPSLVNELAGWARPIVVGRASRPGKYFSNYWTNMDHIAGGQWYADGFDFLPLFYMKRRGLFQVPLGRALFLVERNALTKFAKVFAKTAGSGIDTYRRACLAATDAGLGIYVDNRKKYADLFDPDEVNEDINLNQTYTDMFSSNCNISVDFKEKTLRIPRERGLSLKDYFEKYADTQTPVIIEDYAAAFEEMSVQNILKVCGNKQVSIARRDSTEGLWANIQWFQHGFLKDAAKDISDLSKQSSIEDFSVERSSMLGVFDWALQKYCPEILEKHFTMPKYIAQDFLQRVPHEIELHYRDLWPSLFIGVNGTYGGLHRDVFGSSFWMYVIEGEKEWHVIDSVEGTDMFHSDAASARHFHDVVRKGQLVIIPGHRWHQVRNLGTTATLAGNFVSRGSFETMEAVVKEGEETLSYYRELESTLLAPDFDVSVDFDEGDMTWSKFRNQRKLL